jgi:parvulin-like peptidyl-prolyl isomerase
MPGFVMLLYAALLVAITVPAVPAAASPADGVVARYEGGTVTREEYADWLLANRLEDRADKRRDYLEAIALAESLEASAVKSGLDRAPHTAFRLAQIETDLLEAALRQEADRAVVVGETEVEAELKAEDKERFRPRTVQLRNIFKRAPKGASASDRAALRARMEELRRQLLAGADFDALAWRESDSQTRFLGGALGFVPAGALHPDVERVAFSLKKGEVSPVLQSADGFTLLRCDDISEARVIPVEEARETIRRGLWRRASEARQAELRAELLREAAPRFEEGTNGRDDSAVATFRGGRITLAELRWMAAPSPVEALSPEGRRALLEAQIVRRTAADRARARGLDRDRALRARNAWQRATLLATDEIARRVNLTLSPPAEAEMRAHYERNREKYVKRPEVDVSVILWPLDSKDTRKTFAEAEAVLERIRAGELAFEEAARQVSVHASAAQGGRLGFFRPGQLAQLGPNVFRTVQDLSPGQTSGLVQQDDRLWLVKLWERRPERPLTYEEAAQQVEQEMGDARVAVLRDAREAEARRALQLEVLPEAEPIAP